MKRCADCSFLCHIDKATGDLLPATLLMRQKGETPKYDFQSTRGIVFKHERPACFVEAGNMHEDTRDVNDIILQERMCDQFQKHIPGVNPKERLQMLGLE